MTIGAHNPYADLIDQLQITGDPYLAAAIYPWLSEREQTENEYPIFSHRRYPRLFAQAAFTPASLLIRISQETDLIVLQKLAKNPATPVIALEQLARQKIVPLQPIIARHQNASPHLLNSFDQNLSASIRQALSHNSNTSLLQLKRLLPESTLAEAKGFAQNPNADTELLDKLWSSHGDAFLRAEISQHANCPSSLLVEALRSEDPLLRRKAAASPNLTLQQTTDLLTDDVAQVRVAALRHMDSANMSNSDLTFVEESVGRVRRELARRKELSPVLIEQLSHDQDHWVRRWIARHQDCPMHLLAKLAVDPQAEVRRGVTRNPQTPIDWLEKLATDNNAWVRAGVAYRTDLTLNIIKQLADDHSIDVLAGLGRNSNTPVSLLTKIIRHRDRDVRRSVILNSKVPLAQLKQLTDDPYALNRVLLCQHPILDSDSLWLLLEDPEPLVRFSAMQALARQVQSLT